MNYKKLSLIFDIIMLICFLTCAICCSISCIDSAAAGDTPHAVTQLVCAELWVGLLGSRATDMIYQKMEADD